MRLMPSSAFEVRPGPGHPGRFELVGELDMASAPELLAKVGPAADGDHDIVLDLRELSFVDSTGISALVGISGRLQAATLTLEAPKPNVARVLRLVGADAFPNVRVDWGD
jgi:anti-anti-sigma factor